MRPGRSLAAAGPHMKQPSPLHNNGLRGRRGCSSTVVLLVLGFTIGLLPRAEALTHGWGRGMHAQRHVHAQGPAQTGRLLRHHTSLRGGRMLLQR